jgi:5,10-methylenetetrahydrofolate reductase
VRHAKALQHIYDFGAKLAPRLRGALQWVGRGRAERLMLPVEKSIKQALFDCQMCGQCVLSSTGMACPTNCAKQMRNGPCGGVRPDGGCEVQPDMPCVWVEATRGRQAVLGAAPLPTGCLAPIDHRRAGSSSWIRVIAGEPPVTLGAAQPAAPRERPIHGFERACRSGRFVVTVEIAPPDSADPAPLIARAALFKELSDAVNITDGAGGNCHMSSAAAAAVLATHGLTPVYQVACRDRNRIAIQGDLLGAAALGIHNILCLTGDDVGQGDQPEAKPVFDLDSVSLLHVARTMRDRGEFASGRKLDVPPDLFLGATTNPFMPPFLDRVANLEAKIEAGAQFIQTQFCFDPEMFADFMREVRGRELHKRAAIIVGVGTLNSAKGLAWMAHHVPGVHVPQKVIDRIARADNQQREGQTILVETIRRLAEIEGVAGVHLMGHRNEQVLAEAIIEAGLRRPGASLTTVSRG